MSRFNASRSYPEIDWPFHQHGSSFHDAPWPANTPAGHSIKSVQAQPEGLHTLDGACRKKPIYNAQSRQSSPWAKLRSLL